MASGARRRDDDLSSIAFEAIAHLAGDIGPRAPTSPQEAEAADWFAARLESFGLQSEVGEFPGYRSFGHLYLPIFGLALISRRFRNRRLRRLGCMLSLLIGWWEGEFRSWGRLAMAFPGRGRNVWATIEPEGAVERTVCVVSHLDSSRSGLMFHPAMGAQLGTTVGVVSASLAGSALAPLLSKLPFGVGRLARGVDRLSGLLLGLGFGLILERELRGEDVPGANDNASGVGGCLALAKALNEERLKNTRVVILATGGEEAGLLGMRQFLADHETEDWLFLNLDGIGAAAPLRYLRVEGGPFSPRYADQAMLRLAEEISQTRPDLGLSGCDHGSGMPYDATAVLAWGGRAMTITTQGRTIPNYHWPSDQPGAIDREALGLAIEFAQEMLAGIDRGEADRRA